MARRTTNGHATDEAVDLLYAYFPGTTPAPAICPEAALSLTLKGTVQGIEALLTIRGQSPAEFQRNLASVKGLLDPVQSPTQGQEGAPIKDWCPVHQTRMKLTTKHGQSWWSHYDEAAGRWCKGR
jgi:hypothetical protein